MISQKRGGWKGHLEGSGQTSAPGKAKFRVKPGCPWPLAAELSIPQGWRSQDLSELCPGAAPCSSWFVFPNVVSHLHHLGLPMHPLVCLGVPSPLQTPQIMAASWGMAKSLVSAGEEGRVKSCSCLCCESTWSDQFAKQRTDIVMQKYSLSRVF